MGPTQFLGAWASGTAESSRTRRARRELLLELTPLLIAVLAVAALVVPRGILPMWLYVVYFTVLAAVITVIGLSLVADAFRRTLWPKERLASAEPQATSPEGISVHVADSATVEEALDAAIEVLRRRFREKETGLDPVISQNLSPT